jgi:hypothetical protein
MEEHQLTLLELVLFIVPYFVGASVSTYIIHKGYSVITARANPVGNVKKEWEYSQGEGQLLLGGFIMSIGIVSLGLIMNDLRKKM